MYFSQFELATEIGQTKEEKSKIYYNNNSKECVIVFEIH